MAAAAPTSPSLLEFLLSPTPTTILISLLVVFLTPLILHTLIFRTRASTTLPTFVLLGPSSSGKTTLMTTFVSSPAETRVSQAPLSLECDIPANITASTKYRAEADPSRTGTTRFLLQDTPGHGKLRPRATELVVADTTKGVVFVVDSSAQEWRDAGEYLYSALLRIQKLQEARGTKAKASFPVLVACNKSDLFTALPAARIRRLLEEEMGRVREARSRGIVGVGDEDKEDDEWLGEGGSAPFTFEALEDAGIQVEFAGGSTLADGWRQPLGKWVGSCL
ncbi:signal recognition particle receptor beta subunit-domain-containing protein [Tricharina praecox]|uniref:signal recognition particle receptor beta subunit-domain-containing protein n=1 Tax=Tricharina praecox TaxID=43433 RepID=UPI00221FBB9C|nr:signal recognition particle receptor beta subunit-domain-containing protein [Tricharina praecox]KAI5843238.1 signal recognition particle receptor beta subunit-domain-containing protein [Tricharina praecox]